MSSVLSSLKHEVLHNILNPQMDSLIRFRVNRAGSYFNFYYDDILILQVRDHELVIPNRITILRGFFGHKLVISAEHPFLQWIPHL
jgi:hypothetical protein